MNTTINKKNNNNTQTKTYSHTQRHTQVSTVQKYYSNRMHGPVTTPFNHRPVLGPLNLTSADFFASNTSCQFATSAI